MLSRYISRLLGNGPISPLEEQLRAEVAEYARKYDSPRVHHQSDRNGPYSGNPVPQAALFDHAADYIDEWTGDWLLALASNGLDAIVFHALFEAETESGEVMYDEDARILADLQPARRLAYTVKIHERLEAGEASCTRVVKFLGSTRSSYRIEYPASNIRWDNIPHDNKDPDVLLALHQRWALQLLCAFRYIHSKGVVLNAPQGSSIWLRPDLSLMVAAFVAASCPELDIPAGCMIAANTLFSPFGPSDMRKTDPPFGVDECGQPKTDLFDWACWVYELMSKRRRQPTVVETIVLDDRQHLSHEERQKRGLEVRKGVFDDWPILQTEQLGPCLIKAWKGEYESAEEALQDVRNVLKTTGRTLVPDMDDEIEGFDWEMEFGS
ncbi:hypothetical protein BTJ68_10702 [Hortaea werneckii EXF-2000]|uniref:Protein kinase domain-containing protein n=2 Tax=Hortaea werneckii TaxID=91943 RepID=A0A3M7IPJ9_HORWE|nr:hypothetical protein BTJ68_10702 [Hortaea werneckii EXF-2000]RMZ27282.1 hypothetical protein D0859_08652 [Hortaea werneckii]